MKTIIPMCVSGLLLFQGVVAEEVEIKEVTPQEQKKIIQKEPKVQIAILLDSSTSMNGLINQARNQLWDIVNTFIDAKVGDKVPFVEVAFYTHGQGSTGENGDHIRQIQPLTRDLDQISSDLFSLQTTGSKEFCGTAVLRATNELAWDSDPNTYKAIFIAGNETFHQGEVKAEDACKQAIAKGIIVNTIYCGNQDEGLKGGWKDAAVLADGKFAFIEQNKQIVHIETPFDDKILKLNEKLNTTYVTFNDVGRKRLKVQKEVDVQNEASNKKAMMQRVATKSTANYFNGNWDLLDASTGDKFEWGNIDEKQLPKELVGLTDEQKDEWVAQKREERKKIQSEIQKLNTERSKFVAKKSAESTDGDSLGSAVQSSVRKQAEAKGYKFTK